VKPSDPLLMTRPPSPADDLMHGWILVEYFWNMLVRSEGKIVKELLCVR